MKVGVYIHDGFTFEPVEECPYYWGRAHYDRYLDWLSAFGVEVVEYCQQLGWYRYPALAEELDRLRVRQRLVDEAHRRGMQFSLIVGTNLRSRLPWDQIPPGQVALDDGMCTECPQVGDGFQRTAELGRYFARVFQGADAFEVFAGDWGGCACGRCGVDQYIRYVAYHASHLADEQPEADVWANLWAIGYWGPRPARNPDGTGVPFWRATWDEEIAASERFLASLDQVPEAVGLSLPMHFWYRGFCQQWYSEDELPRWPDLAALRNLQAGGRRLSAWTHFIVENDPYHGRLWGTLSVRLRYIKALCEQLSLARFEIAMGNVYSGRQALNLHAFCSFCRDPGQSVDEVLSDFVDRVAIPSGHALLADILIYLENRDPWHDGMPPFSQLAPLPESGIRRASIDARLPELAGLLRPDSPLLLGGPLGLTRAVEAALALHP